MAYERVVYVRKLDLPYMQKLILFAIAARADDCGRCAVSIDGLHSDTGLARRTVQLHLQALLALQFVSREVRPGRTPLVICPSRATRGHGGPRARIRRQRKWLASHFSQTPIVMSIAAMNWAWKVVLPPRPNSY